MPLSPTDVVAQFHQMVASDGSSLSLVAVENGCAQVRYQTSGDAHCETCVLTPSDLRDMLSEAFQRNDRGIREVEMV
ncbi:NifU family protein [Oryzicola mucosus]|uniref:NifU family protein n=1 Tax=Oryzicola mucosus TaxID=2767425 RepID=A0A8J6PZS4_9HYPH|nr:NifU family protein [Oryzicola mucosus]MBD0417377.1 NifU family protein [Oryzicola mucosus]